MSAEIGYETMLIFSVADGDEKAAELVEKFKALIEENGTLESMDEWGKRKLAYPINDELEGYYVLLHFLAGPDFPAELERVLKITDGVLRYLTIRR